MIKTLGTFFFLGSAVAVVIMGVTTGPFEFVYIGVTVVALVVLVALLVKCFPSFFESEECGREAMQVVRAALRGGGLGD